MTQRAEEVLEGKAELRSLGFSQNPKRRFTWLHEGYAVVLGGRTENHG